MALPGEPTVCPSNLTNVFAFEERDIGLTNFYNLFDEGAFDEIRALHRQLDEAVATAYGWPKGVAADRLEIRARLAELHRRIADGEAPYEPFTYLAPPDTV